jgi:hypothetical protein
MIARGTPRQKYAYRLMEISRWHGCCSTKTHAIKYGVIAAHEPMMSNDSRPQEISVDTVRVLEKEEATREKLLRRSTLENSG